jgi:hypothetical protein
MLTRLIPWLDTEDGDETRRLQAETAEMEREQHELAPFIADQTAYLVGKGKVNGFSNQLRLGFQQRATEQ